MEVQEEKLARALSASSRRHILRLLVRDEKTVNEVAEAVGLSVSLASRHLKFLFDLGFLSVRKKSPYKYYSLKIPELKQLLESYEKVIRKL
ncbi:winged helix-turn-helix transcriptional regulator [Candidatus Woesearchaeota archaeon]|nr:winged helix-turn-helix transcriptional regulator [Candidatus Woesearchaeota archaeon]MBT5739544.1 winged helix-turn-helix transcriptional regulator [Candidatus Woesearchaeota archaeon]